jgi:hypothetical protein
VDEDLGGGASRSTDPAGGTSSATDVSLREYIGASIGSLDRFVSAEIRALRRETENAREASDRAIEVAAHEAAERLAAHNGLIEQMRQQAATFATRESQDDYKSVNDNRLSRIESFQAKLTGGLIILAAIGVANLVKVWTG